MKTWTYADRHPTYDGPWADEPDKVQWVHEETDLDCLIVRNRLGALCGYVGVPPGHPWHGLNYSKIEPEPEVHGDLTFSSFCDEGVDIETQAAVCHVPEPGRPDHVWWLGFDCAHGGFDCVPMLTQPPIEYRERDQGPYRDIAYVTAEVEQLARQVHAGRNRG